MKRISLRPCAYCGGSDNRMRKIFVSGRGTPNPAGWVLHICPGCCKAHEGRLYVIQAGIEKNVRAFFSSEYSRMELMQENKVLFSGMGVRIKD